MVAGYRVRRADPWGRRLKAAGWNWLVRRLLDVQMRDVNCAFKLIRRTALEGVALESEGATVSAELLARIRRRGYRIVEMPVAHFPRRAGAATGGRPRVMLRGFVELLGLSWRLRAEPTDATAETRDESAERRCIA
jgi:hypothetical protein